MFDIFYVGSSPQEFENLRSSYKNAQWLPSAKSFDTIKNESFTNHFWIIWDGINLLDDFDLNSYSVSKWDNDYIHVFLNGKHWDGPCLANKKIKVTQKEFDHNFFIHKKQIEKVASQPKKYDIVFISYDEPDAEENYKALLEKNLNASIHRVHGVKGIHNAHAKAAKKANTEMFWVVDGDSVIDENFMFDYYIPKYDVQGKETVHVWRSQNPVNDLIYGYGGIKLLPTNLTMKMDKTKPDMTTSISDKFKAVQQISNITAFNTDPFNAWKSGFRECAKLAAKVIDRQKDRETEDRLDVWCSKGHDRPFGDYAIRGAIAGRKYGYENKNSINKLKKINDFNWLKKQFDDDNENRD